MPSRKRFSLAGDIHAADDAHAKVHSRQFSERVGCVEAGQIAIGAVFLPLAYALRGAWLYRRLIFVAGSAAIVVISTRWSSSAPSIFGFCRFIDVNNV